MWQMMAVVVDFPLVPVTPTTRCGGSEARAKANNSMSPMTGTPARRAYSAIGWRLSGTPGDTTTPSKPRSTEWSRSPTSALPATAARASSRLSQAITSAPLATSASTLARPERARPRTAYRFPAKAGLVIIASPQLQGRQAGERQHEADDPEADDDRRLRPAELLEMVVDRRHPEDALAGALVDQDLDDHRQRLDDEQAADDAEHDLVLGGDGDGAERATQSEAAGVAHEDRGGRRVEPEEGEARADDRRAQHGEIANAEHMRDSQIGRIVR